jgi:hypothetical protein
MVEEVGIPEDRICKTITNPRTKKPVAPMTLARAFARELESGATEFHALVGVRRRYWVPAADMRRAAGYYRARRPSPEPTTDTPSIPRKAAVLAGCRL